LITKRKGFELQPPGTALNSTAQSAGALWAAHRLRRSTMPSFQRSKEARNEIQDKAISYSWNDLRGSDFSLLSGFYVPDCEGARVGADTHILKGLLTNPLKGVNYSPVVSYFSYLVPCFDRL
jgi:hypothetical protein